MQRREFIGLVGCAAVAWPVVARAQPAAMPVVGYLGASSRETTERLVAAFLLSLKEAGFIEGQNVAIEYLFSDGQDDRLPALASALVRRGVTAIVATDRPSAVAAKATTSTIPILFSSGVDPVEIHLVESLNRPGGNATGVSLFTSEIGPKRLELLRELVPKAALIAFIVNPTSGSAALQTKEMQAAARAVGQQILILNASTAREIDAAFASLVEQKAAAVLYSANPLFQVRTDQLVALAARHAIPAMYEWPEFVKAGGLMSYSTSRAEAYRQIGIYAGRVLKGEKPADLPVVQSSKFELAINLNTARALRLVVPPTLIARADEVIE